MRVKELQLIDWAERFPTESSLQIAIRQSTICTCGSPKVIGEPICRHHILGKSQAESEAE
jgi:hypothetical protein